MENLVIYIVSFFLTLFVILFIAKAVFLVNKNDRIQSAQLKLLAEIAAKSGVDPKRITIILRVADDKTPFLPDQNIPLIRQDLPTEKTNVSQQ